MREDMFKVIVERPRRGRSWATKSKLRYDRCEDRSHVSGKRLVTEHTGATKYLNENLAPLKRYLFKQRGRRWDDVFSEICEHLDTGSTVKMHVREHLDDFIMRRVTLHNDGSMTAASRWGSPEGPESWWAELYVDPRNGTIKETRALCRKLGVKTRRGYWQNYHKSDNKPVLLKRLSDKVVLAKLSAIWYQIEISQWPVTSYGSLTSNEVLYEKLSKGTWTEDKGFCVIAKRQLSKKQLKAHGLTNGKARYYD